MVCNCDVLCECPPFEGDENLWDGEFGTYAVQCEEFRQAMVNAGRRIGKTISTFVSALYDPVVALTKSLAPPPKSPNGPPEDLSKRPQVSAQAIPRLPERCAPVAQLPLLAIRTSRHVPP